MKVALDSMMTAHTDHVKNMLEISNQSESRSIYEGFQSLPRQSAIDSFEIYLMGENGLLTTSRYGEVMDRDYYKTNRSYTYILGPFDELIEHMGEGSLKIDLEVNLIVEDGWEESVSYIEGSQNKF